MITEQEQEQVRFLSDTALYVQARAFMRAMGRPLSPTQINGLLNVSLNNTYNELKRFIKGQYERESWRPTERHIPEFYRKLERQLEDLEAQARSIIKARSRPSSEDMQSLSKLLAREFIQHVLAEHAYMGATRAFHQGEHDQTSNQGGPQRDQRGPALRQGGQNI